MRNWTKPRAARNDAELFLQHLDSIVRRPEDTIVKVESSDPNLPNVYIFVYRDWPEPGMLTGFTLGLSAARHPDWTLGRPELMISVESADEAWPLAAGCVAEGLRGKASFCYGDTIDFKAQVSDESGLDAFLVFAPAFLKPRQRSVDLNDYRCMIAGLYPMYVSEIGLYREIGLESFWNHPELDVFDVRREPISRDRP